MQLSSMRLPVAMSLSAVQQNAMAPQPQFSGSLPKALTMGAAALFTATQLAGCANTTTKAQSPVPSMDQSAESRTNRKVTCADIKTHIETVIAPQLEKATDGKNYGRFQALIATCNEANGEQKKWLFPMDNVPGFKQSDCKTMGNDVLPVFKTDIGSMLHSAKHLTPTVELYCSNTPPPMPQKHDGTTSVFNPFKPLHKAV